MKNVLLTSLFLMVSCGQEPSTDTKSFSSLARLIGHSNNLKKSQKLLNDALKAVNVDAPLPRFKQEPSTDTKSLSGLVRFIGHSNNLKKSQKLSNDALKDALKAVNVDAPLPRFKPDGSIEFESRPYGDFQEVFGDVDAKDTKY